MIENRVDRIPDLVNIRRVIISVYDKTGLENLVTSLMAQQKDLEIYSTGGTYRACEKILGDSAKEHLYRISDYTGQPEMHGGLVKTLDFRIYLGLLSEPFSPVHQDDLKRGSALAMDMVVVNLYPFREVVSAVENDSENARSNIDIGGPCMLRAAAKNFIRVTAVNDPSDYPLILAEMAAKNGAVSLKTRFRMAVKAFEQTASYDTSIVAYLSGVDPEVFKTVYTLEEGEYHG